MTEDTFTITLSKPISHGEGEAKRTWKELTFREAEVGDMMAADAVQGENSKIAAVLASISGVPLPAFKQVRQRDLMRIMSSEIGKTVGNSSAPASTGAEPQG